MVTVRIPNILNVFTHTPHQSDNPHINRVERLQRHNATLFIHMKIFEDPISIQCRTQSPTLRTLVFQELLGIHANVLKTVRPSSFSKYWRVYTKFCETTT